MIQKYKIYDAHQVIFETINKEEFGKKIEQLKMDHTLIQAAGGIVHNPLKEILFIERLGRIDLPKGKMETGETPILSALREVEEECGISDLEIIGLKSKTYHIYVIKQEKILKETFWFDMQSKGKELLKPQLEEGITKVFWANKQKYKKHILKMSYPLIIDLLYPNMEPL